MSEKSEENNQQKKLVYNPEEEPKIYIIYIFVNYP